MIALLLSAVVWTMPPTFIEACPRIGPRHSCIVDGDTLWLCGVKFRLEGFDTPEIRNGCGGAFERKLAIQARDRLQDLLSQHKWVLKYDGKEGKYGRMLATILIDWDADPMVDVGNLLVLERLARHWPDGEEWWC